MNKERRAELDKAIALIEEAKGIIETAAGEEREAYDNLPENMQSGDKGEAMDAAATALEEAQDECDQVIDKIGEGKGE